MIKSKDLKLASKFLSNEEVVAIPTETVYGLAANMYSDKAVRTIFDVKKRPAYNPLIVHIGSIDWLDRLVTEVPENAHKLIGEFWPGPLTLLLNRTSEVPDLVTGGSSRVAVRMPSHGKMLELLNQLDFPLVAPSANPFKSISPTCAEHVEDYFEDKIPMVLDGGHCSSGIESTIVGFEDEETVLYRPGPIPVERIEQIVGHVRVQSSFQKQPDAPGMLKKHYSPKTRTVIIDDPKAFIQKHKGDKVGLTLFTDSNLDLPVEQIILSQTGNLDEAASRLYDAMHQMDRKGLDLIAITRFPDEGVGKSLNDRISRAAHV